MGKETKQFSVFDVQGYRFKANSQEDYKEKSDKLANLIYDAKNLLEREIVCGKPYYKQLLSWLELIANKEIKITDILAKGEYSKTEQAAKTVALTKFIKLLKANQGHLTKEKKKELYKRFLLLGLRKDSIENIKNGIIAKRITCSEQLCSNVTKLNNIIEDSCGEMVSMYLPYAINMANKKGMRYDEEGNQIGSFVDDYTQAALIGIYEAAKHFNPKKKISFTTYAWYWMIEGFSEVVEANETIRFPRNVKFLKNKINKFIQKDGNTTNVDILSSKLKETPGSIQRALEYNKTISLERPALIENEETNIAETLSDGHNIEADVENLNKKELLASIMNKKLEGRDKEIICMRFGLDDYKPHTFREMAKKLGITTEGTRQATKNALRKIIPEIVKNFGEEYGECDTEKVLKMHCKTE